MVIEDKQVQVIACAGVDWDKVNEYRCYEIKHQIYYSTQVSCPKGLRLITPIFIKKKIYGFCSFLYSNAKKPHKVEQLVLKRVATVCSLYMLSEKNRFEMTEHIKGSFFNEIIDGNLSKEEILRRGHYVNLDLTKAYVVVALNFFQSNRHISKNVMINESMMEEVLKYFKDKSKSLIGQRSGKIIFLIQMVGVIEF